MTYANRDAIRLYRLALTELGREPLAAARNRRQNGGRLQEALAEVLLITGKHDEARSALEAALGDSSPAERLARARRQRLLARTWEKIHQHERALALLANAERELLDGPDEPDELEAFWFERVQIQIQFVQHLYFLSRLDELAARIGRVRPVIEERGTPLQRSQFLQALVLMSLRRDRYLVDEEWLQVARAALSAASDSGDPAELAIAHFGLAFMLVLARRELEAEPLYATALAAVERVGDAALEARILSYYTVVHRRLGRVAQTRAMAMQALAIAEKHGFYDYVGVAFANLCWVALVEGGDAEAAASRALSAWQALPANYPYPLQWLVRAPLAAHLGQTGRAHEALSHWEQMLSPTQAQLPDELRLAIETALRKRADPALMDTLTLSPIAEVARRFGYL
jgi:tetratricopeptide (TPR) repeat protein